MPLFVDALIGDTLHLSAEEFGAYCLLLFATWRNNGQPLADDDEELARICRTPLAKWNKGMRSKLVRFFDLSEGVWRQGRLEHEWEYVQKKASVSRKNGGKGGRPRKNPAGYSRKPSGLAAGNPEGTQTVTTQPQPHTHKKNLSQPAIGVSDPGARDGEAEAGWLAGFEISIEWIDEARLARETAGKPPVDLREEARKAVIHWRSAAPGNPHRAWIGWAMNAHAGNANGAASQGPDRPRQVDAPTGPPPPLPVPH